MKVFDLDVDRIVRFQPICLDYLISLNELPHLFSGQLFRRVDRWSWKKNETSENVKDYINLPLALSLTRGSLSHSASLHSDVTLLCVVELLSLRDVSALRTGGGGGNSSSAWKVRMKHKIIKIKYNIWQWSSSVSIRRSSFVDDSVSAVLGMRLRELTYKYAYQKAIILKVTLP